jgi:hypothetical protein
MTNTTTRRDPAPGMLDLFCYGVAILGTMYLGLVVAFIF